MKRAHRRSHLLIWALLAPIIFGLFAFAIMDRPDAPMNDSVPDALIEEAS